MLFGAPLTPTEREVPVKFPKFDYVAPESVDECLEAIADDEALVLAGGQSLLPLMALRMVEPFTIVDITGLSPLQVVDTGQDAGGLRVGAAVRQSELEDLSALESLNPLLHKALPFVGHRAIRTRGTVGGSLAHADPAAEWPALCVTLDAEIILRSTHATRCVKAEDFFVGPFMTTRSDDELLTEVRLPSWQRGRGAGLAEVARRRGDFATVGAMAAVTCDHEGKLATVAIAVFGGLSAPMRLNELEYELPGTDSAEWTESIAAAVETIRFTSDIHGSSSLRRHLAGRVVLQALHEAKENAHERD